MDQAGPYSLDGHEHHRRPRTTRLAQLTTDGHLSGSMSKSFPRRQRERLATRRDFRHQRRLRMHRHGCVNQCRRQHRRRQLYVWRVHRPGRVQLRCVGFDGRRQLRESNFDLFPCGCEGILLDATGVCGRLPDGCGRNGVCDDVDECIGTFDDCGICNGPGAIYECGCPGVVLDAVGECGGTCTADEDEDGVCDDVDDCIGTYDACGVCNGPGEVYDCGCAPLPGGDCDCDGNVADALGVCGGGCTADADGDGIWTTRTNALVNLTSAGMQRTRRCPGCGCTKIPDGDCDCDGNVEDALGSVEAIASPTKTTTASRRCG